MLLPGAEPGPCTLAAYPSYRLNHLYTCTGGKENFGVLHSTPSPTPILGARSLLPSRPPNLWGKERAVCAPSSVPFSDSEPSCLLLGSL